MAEKCNTCEENAVLHVGDAICHKIQKSGGKIDCHGLVHRVKERRMTVGEYVDELDRSATSNEKRYIGQLRKLMESQ
jgi:hypothetical protein